MFTEESEQSSDGWEEHQKARQQQRQGREYFMEGVAAVSDAAERVGQR